MACFVTGIAPTQNIAELESMLGAISGIDTSKLTVITKADRSYEHDSSFLNFFHAGGPTIDGDASGQMIDGTAIMTGGGGTGVPGIGSSTASLSNLAKPKAAQHVGNLPIPEDEADNYNDAIEDGRCVVAYECDGTQAAAIEEAFRGAGLRKVKSF